MFGASLAKRLPGAKTPPLRLELGQQGLFLLWLLYMGWLVFGAVLIWQRGGWEMLLTADPTGLTISIMVLFVACSLWAGRRAWVLGLQRQHLDEVAQRIRQGAVPSQLRREVWVEEYWRACNRAGNDPGMALSQLGERAHGPHEMGWWFNGIQLKLGLLGKVIGFSILALELGHMESIDASQSALILRNLTGGLGIALLTTMTGLAGNILLGLQLMRLDRFADLLVSDALSVLQHDWPRDGGVGQPAAPESDVEG